MKAMSLIGILLFAPLAMADTFQSSTAAKEFTDKVMMRLAAGDFEGGLKMMKPYTIIPEAEFDAMMGQAKLQLPAISQRFGKPIGREFIREDKVGDSLVKIVQLLKHEKHALRWTFYFYKSRNGWVLNTFHFDDRIQDLFPR